MNCFLLYYKLLVISYPCCNLFINYAKWHIRQPGGVGVLTRGGSSEPVDHTIPSPLHLP